MRARDVGKPGAWVDVVQLGGGDQRVHGSGSVPPRSEPASSHDSVPEQYRAAPVRRHCWSDESGMLRKPGERPTIASACSPSPSRHGMPGQLVRRSPFIQGSRSVTSGAMCCGGRSTRCSAGSRYGALDVEDASMRRIASMASGASATVGQLEQLAASMSPTRRLDDRPGLGRRW